MPITQDRSTPDTASGPIAAGGSRATRFDPPHAMRRGDLPGDAVPAPPGGEAALELALADLPVESTEPPPLESGEVPTQLVRQFRTQAHQLADHLEQRQRELDHREAELNSRVARQEAAARSNRLWLQEQHRKLAMRQEETDERERSLAGKTGAGSVPKSMNRDDALPLASTEVEIDLHLREADFHELSAQLQSRQLHADTLLKNLKQREKSIEQAEARLARHEAELRFSQSEFQGERDAFAERREHLQRQLVAEREQWQADAGRQRRELKEQGAMLDKRAAAIKQLQEELQETQRETLELQLAAEEVRAELAGIAPAANVSKSLARLRAKLADQYRMQQTELDRQRAQIVASMGALAEHEAGLQVRREELEHWAIEQQRQLEYQATLLAERELLIEKRQRGDDDRRLRWESERRELLAEMRRIEAALRRLEANQLDLT